MSRFGALVTLAILMVALGATADSPPESPRSADTGAAGIRLLSSSSFIAVLGEDVKPFDIRLPGAQYTFRNASGTELLTLYQSPGAERYSISEFGVQLLKKPDADVFPGNPAHFKTDRGIVLGISRSDLEAMLGKPTREQDNTLHYRIEPRESAEWLRSFNMPYYEASYSFAEGRLTSILFGFPYP